MKKIRVRAFHLNNVTAKEKPGVLSDALTVMFADCFAFQEG